MKKLIENGDALSKEGQKGINGGFYLQPGYHLHPGGLCLCCKDQSVNNAIDASSVKKPINVLSLVFN
ncbi:MAG: hypothetical protein HWE22_20505 [Flavobacteriales bacterium]|nr:hypothetical protein [Flavobacteriales bacterium]